MEQDNRFGYWFSASDILPNGDGRKIILGESLKVEGKLELCKRGLHYSVHPFDALKYVKGFNLYKVKALGDILEDIDKCCTNERQHLEVKNPKDTILLFSRNQAKKVIHLWDAPNIVIDFLNTGDSNLAIWAAEAAIWAAEADARTAARAAARAAVKAARAAEAATWPAEAAIWAAEAAIWAAEAAIWAAEADARTAAAEAAELDYRKEFEDMINTLFLEEI